MSRTPLISACVPTYNGAEYLDACLSSLLEQDLKDLEVVVGDDLSTDDTLEIARRRDDPRVRVLAFDSNAGMAGNWNRCIARARGKYVALVAQDDLVAPQWGERLAQLLESHPEADLAFGRREFSIADERSRSVVGEFFEKSYPALLERFYRGIETVIPPEDMLDAALERLFEVNLIGEPSFTLVRRDHPATRAGYHPRMKQLIDWEFASRFFVERPILHCPEILGTYRIHASASSVGSAASASQHREYMLLLESVLVHFMARLSPEQVERIESRRDQGQADIVKHARILEAEVSALRAHVGVLEAELHGHRGHVQNLERILEKIHGRRIYSVLCKIKDTLGGRPK